MHLLAISGLHVLFVGLAVYRLLRALSKRLRLSWWQAETTSVSTTLVILTLYTLVTGSSPSVVRASIMATGFLCSPLVRRTSNSINALGTAGLTILMIDSHSLFKPGFQLSFSAVLGLITVGASASRWIGRRVRRRFVGWGLGLVAASAVATLSTTPVMVAQFGYVPLAGIALNLAAIPVASALLMASLLTPLLALSSASAGSTLGFAVDLLATCLTHLAELGASTSKWTLLTLQSGLETVVVPVALAVALSRRRTSPQRRVWFLIALLVPAGGLVVRSVQGAYEPRLEVVFFDVGHGDAALVRLPSRKYLLVDAGNRTPFRDYGERVILPHLRKYLVRNLDAVIVSHADADHYGGLSTILRKVYVKCVYDNGKPSDTNLYREYLVLVSERVGCRETLVSGNELKIDPQVRIIVLAPPPGYESTDQNDQSVVVSITFGQNTMLFTGDIEANAERLLSKRFCSSLRSDVVKVPHHGSRTSSTPEFVRCVEADRAIISVGHARKFGLPDEEVVERWSELGTRVLITRSLGAIQLHSDGEVIQEIH
jgi:competence protein ComEC